MLPPYKYYPVASSDADREIRVIYLEPSRNRDAPIFCGLNNISLDDYPEWKADYTALSYTWDGQSPSCEVDCDGCPLLVTPNCDAAIRELRHEEKIVKLWIDSICINQSTDAIPERNHQVAIMGEIYKSAIKVVVWLGTSNIRVEAALNQLVDLFITTASPNVGVGCGRENMNFKNVNQSEMDLRANMQMALGQKVDAISKRVSRDSEDPFGPLFECSWFYRMWTVQEASLCLVERLYVRCGNLEVSWVKLLGGIEGLKICNYSWGRWKQATRLQRQFMIYLTGQRFLGAEDLFDKQPNAADPHNLHNSPLIFSILTNAREKAAGDPRDKIFALCGLFRELEIPFPNPDYSKSIEDVYREAVVASIEYDKNIYILYHVPSEKRRKYLASWVPDWAEQGFSEEDGRYGVLRGRFAASGSSAHKFVFSEDKKKLILTGKIIDEVIICAQPLPNMDHTHAELRDLRTGNGSAMQLDRYFEVFNNTFKILKTWLDISQWSDYPTGESSQSAFQRTLVNDSPDRNERATSDNSFLKWYKIAKLDELDVIEERLRQLNLADQVPKQHHFREAYLRTCKDMIGDAKIAFFSLQGSAIHFHTDAMIWSAKKCLFRTENDYIGTASDPLPSRIRAGDKIALVSGLEMPLLLRPEQDGYKLITHVYVHGVMHGEKWPESNRGLEDIVLL